MEERGTDVDKRRGTIEIDIGNDRSSLLGDDPDNMKKICCIFFFSYLWTLFMTAIPLGATVYPIDYYADHPHWYQGDDVMRLMEPLFGLFINFVIYYYTGIFKRELDGKAWGITFIFFFGAALYEQGGGFHSCANMFKNALQTMNHDDGEIGEFYYWVRTVWEHTIGHYMYAVGYGIMTAVQLYLYKDFKIANPRTFPILFRVLLSFGSLFLAMLIAGVAADFPDGLIVFLVYLVVYGFCCVGGYVFYLWKYTDERNTVLVYQSRPILHHFLLAYILAFIFILIYIASVGGLKTQSEAGIA